MYVCICRAVSDKDVSKAIDEGARSLPDITRACRAGGDCGACHNHIEDMIAERTGEAPVSLRRLPMSVRAA
jgi:bacterioferritin-associated ferredoxin